MDRRLGCVSCANGLRQQDGTACTQGFEPQEVKEVSVHVYFVAVRTSVSLYVCLSQLVNGTNYEKYTRFLKTTSDDTYR